jgi:hypothetical protein
LPSYSDKTALIYDLGLFVDVATELVKDFGRVLYFCPGLEAPFPTSNPDLIGRGIPGVEKIPSIWPYLDDVDLFVFTDVGSGPLMRYLRSIGKRVWGCGMAEDLELNRPKSKKLLSKLGVPIGRYETMRGTTALKEYLKHHPNQYVKVSRFRGDMETFYAQDLKMVEHTIIRDLEHKLGAKSEVMQFVCEDKIEDAVELAYDGYTIDGEWPEFAPIGFEIKDKGYVGRMMRYADLPDQITDTNTMIEDELKKAQCRSWIGMEMRVVTDGTPYVIDPLTRFGSPPGELVQIWFKNFAEILYEGAGGEVVVPEYDHEWGAMLLLHSSYADKNWLAVDVPDELRPYVKFRNLTIIKGQYYAVPQSVGLPEIGAAVATGKTPEEAIKLCRERAEAVTATACYIEHYPESLDEALEARKKLQDFGIDC